MVGFEEGLRSLSAISADGATFCRSQHFVATHTGKCHCVLEYSQVKHSYYYQSGGNIDAQGPNQISQVNTP